MKKIFPYLFLIIFTQNVHAQGLKIKAQKTNVAAQTDFFKSIADTALSLHDRENLILNEIKKGNIPNFLRKPVAIEYEVAIDNRLQKITFFVLPDYLAIGTNDAYLYMPMTPILAQKVANFFKLLTSNKENG